MGDGLDSGSWAVQQLAGLLAALSSYGDETAMLTGAAHRIAEAVDAEVCAVVCSDSTIPAVIGYPDHQIPHEALRAAVASGGAQLDVPGLGTVRASVIELGEEGADHVVLARSRSEFTATDLHLVRSMGQVLNLALQLRRTADRERHLREQSEAQATALRRANTALVEASRTKDMVISVASHELRTPLTAILGFTSTLRERSELLDDEERATYLDIIASQGNRLLQLIEDLLTVGRIEAGRARPERAPVAVVPALRVAIAGQADTVSLHGPVDVLAEVDARHLDQIVLNLVANANKYGRPPVRIEVDSDGPTVSIAVVDAGDGVPEEFVPQLFDRFTQASSHMTRASSGAGLGLAIVRGLTEANGGSVDYQRIASRTRFVVRLPAADHAAAAPARDLDIAPSAASRP